MMNQYRCPQSLFSELPISTARSLDTLITDNVAWVFRRFWFYIDPVVLSDLSQCHAFLTSSCSTAVSNKSHHLEHPRREDASASPLPIPYSLPVC